MEYKENKQKSIPKVDDFNETEKELELNHGSLSSEKKEQLEELLNLIDIHDSTFVLNYGIDKQKDISNFSDDVLKKVTAKDSGNVGESLSELMFKVKEVNVDDLSHKKALSNIPFIGSFFDKAKKFMAQYEKVSTQIDKIAKELNSSQEILVKDISMLDELYERNKSFYEELSLYITAGEMKIKQIHNEQIQVLKNKINKSNKQSDIQELNDLTQLIARFEKKLHDLKLSQNVTLQTSPQIRLIQNNNQVLAEKIHSSVLNTIPMWKNQIVIALSLHRQGKALEVQKEVSDTTNDLLKKNSELMKNNSLNIAKENEKGIVDINTLKKMQSDLIFTLEETMKIQKEGKQNRIEAEKELLNMEAELKQKLLDGSQNEK